MRNATSGYFILIYSSKPAGTVANWLKRTANTVVVRRFFSSTCTADGVFLSHVKQANLDQANKITATELLNRLLLAVARSNNGAQSTA